MVQKILYTCEICNTSFASAEKAKECENHHCKDIVKFTPVFKPIGTGIGKYPYKFVVEFADGHKATYI